MWHDAGTETTAERIDREYLEERERKDAAFRHNMSLITDIYKHETRAEVLNESADDLERGGFSETGVLVLRLKAKAEAGLAESKQEEYREGL